MKTGDLLKLADVIVGIFGVGASVYCGIRCAKINQQQMTQMADMTSDMVIMKLAGAVSDKDKDKANENQN